MGKNEKEYPLSDELADMLGDSNETSETEEKEETEETETPEEGETSEETEEEEGEEEEGEEIEDEVAEGEGSEADQGQEEQEDEDSSEKSDSPVKWENLSSDLVEQNKQLQALVKNLVETQKKPEEPEAPPKAFHEEEIFTEMAEELGLDDTGLEKFKQFIGAMTQRVTNDSVQEAMRATPSAVQHTMRTQQTLENVRNDFYEAHPALDAVKPFVSQIAKQISEADPNKNLETVLTETADQAYKSLGLSAKDIAKQRKRIKGKRASEGDEAGKRKKPAFAKASGARKKAPKLSREEQEMEDMLALDEI